MTINQTSHTEFKKNVRLAKQIWPGSLTRAMLERLRWLTAEFSFSVLNGDLLLMSSGWYVTHAGLLRLATRSVCFQITAELITEFCKPEEHRWVFRAFVQKRSDGSSFSGFGDADPLNVQHSLHGCELRIAETRAVNRALRKAYG